MIWTAEDTQCGRRSSLLVFLFFIYIFQYCHSDFSWTLSWQYLHMLSRMKRHFNIPIYALIADRIINSIAAISELNKK